MANQGLRRYEDFVADNLGVLTASAVGVGGVAGYLVSRKLTEKTGWRIAGTIIGGVIGASGFYAANMAAGVDPQAFD